MKKKRNTFDSISALYEGRESTLNAFGRRILPIKATKGNRRPSNLAMRLIILTPKHMLKTC